MKKIVFLVIFSLIASLSFANVNVIKKDFKDLIGNKFINVSFKDINHFKFPYKIKEVQSSKDISVNIRGKNMFVKLFERIPTELFILLNDPDETTINIILNPKDIPAQTIEFTDKTAEMKKIYEAEKTIPYEKVIRNLIVSVSKKGKIKGYSVLEGGETLKTDELELKKLRTFQGYKYSVEVWQVKNISDRALYLEEPFFYMIGMKAISIEKHNLAQGETTLLYIVR